MPPKSNEKHHILHAENKERRLQNRWAGMVNNQDNAEILRKEAEQKLIEMKTGLNPIFHMDDMRRDHKLARTRDYILEERDAK